MKIETKKYEVEEVYIEGKSLKEVDKVRLEYRDKEFECDAVQAHYGQHGLKEDRMYYFSATKRKDITGYAEKAEKYKTSLVTIGYHSTSMDRIDVARIVDSALQSKYPYHDC